MGAKDVVTSGSAAVPQKAGTQKADTRPAGPFGLKSFPGGFIVGVVIAVAVTLLIIQNGESTQLDWLVFQFQAPLWIMLLLTLIAGGVIAEIGKVVVSRSLAGAKQRRARAHPEPVTGTRRKP